MNRHKAIGTTIAILVALQVPVAARSLPDPAPTAASSKEKVGDAVQTPIEDLNLAGKQIPPILQAARDNPYGLGNVGTCPQLNRELAALDAVLGDDVDKVQPGGRHLGLSDVANFAADTFIPFRGVIREVTGAAARKRRMQEAVLAGFARRSFLKGVGRTRRCVYVPHPAAPAHR